PFIYQGDELGMTNYPFSRIEEFDDIEVKNAWKADVLTGKVPADEFIWHLLRTSRDHSRTPMQWNDSPHGGFTISAMPWLAVNPNYKEINAKQAQTDPDSIYNYFKNVIGLRKKTPALIYGDYQDLDPASPVIFAYTRTLGTDRYLIVLNFSNGDVAYSLPDDLKAGQLVISNVASNEENVSRVNLKAWEARIYRA
ncbi:MAG TPA: alpha-glucosidase C-terminal domain-containing protein, partial [Terrimicrobiaceae bacterium]